MSTSIVFLAPVPAVILESALKVPSLASRVAFGSMMQSLDAMPIGDDVFIYVSRHFTSQPPHPLFKAGVATWGGKLGAIVRAVESGPRSGRHPDPKVRPPLAEATDGPSIYFWEVLGLRKLARPIPLRLFKGLSGGRAFGGTAPEWPVRAKLTLE